MDKSQHFLPQPTLLCRIRKKLFGVFQKVLYDSPTKLALLNSLVSGDGTLRYKYGGVPSSITPDGKNVSGYRH